MSGLTYWIKFEAVDLQVFIDVLNRYFKLQ